MLEVDLSVRLDVLDILPLAGLLLHQLVGYEEADDIVHQAHAQPVAGRKIPFVGSREAGGISSVREIPQHRRIQITDRKSTRLNSSHRCISYAVFCLKKKKKIKRHRKLK